jgi:hypothetical protein
MCVVILQEFGDTCVKDNQWWKNLLFINNLSPREMNLEKECLPWTWYLGNDMQLFVVGLLVMILEACVPRAGLVTVLALGIASQVAGTHLVHKQHLNTDPFVYTAPGVHREDLTTHYYSEPWYLWPSYAVGMCAGWMYQAVTADVAECLMTERAVSAGSRTRTAPTSPRQRPKDAPAGGKVYNFTELGSLQRADSGLSAALLTTSDDAEAGGAKRGDPHGAPQPSPTKTLFSTGSMREMYNAKPGDAMLYACVDTCGWRCAGRFTSLCGPRMPTTLAHSIVALSGAWIAFLFYAPVSSYEKPGWSDSYNTFYTAWGKVTFCIALGAMLHVLHLGRMPWLGGMLEKKGGRGSPPFF